MKKVLLSLLIALCLVLMPSVKADDDLPVITDHEKVTIYLFRSSSCGYCQNFIQYFAENYAGYEDYFEIITYEVSDEDNYVLMQSTKERFGETDSGSIPYIVIGTTYDQLGFSESSASTIIEEALNAYQDETYTDLVAQIIEEEGLDPEVTTLAEAAAYYGYSMSGADSSSSGLSDGVVVGIIFGVLILGFGGLILYSRKK